MFFLKQTQLGKGAPFLVGKVAGIFPVQKKSGESSKNNISHQGAKSRSGLFRQQIVSIS